MIQRREFMALAMERRQFISCLALAAVWPTMARSQNATAVVGILSTTSADAPSGPIEVIQHALQQAAVESGKTVRIEYRNANNQLDRLPVLATELVAIPATVIIATGGPASALAAKAATETIPIVFAPISDPVRSGLVSSLHRPGGNATGIAALTIELDPKRFELLNELAPGKGALGVLLNPARPDADAQLAAIRLAAQAIGREFVTVHATTRPEIESALATLADRSIEGLLVGADPFFSGERAHVVRLANHYKWPAIYQWKEFVDVGGLASYGPNLADSYRQTALLASRILNGAKPTELPVQQPTKFEFVLNLQTAKSSGIAVPISLLGRADTVIE